MDRAGKGGSMHRLVRLIGLLAALALALVVAVRPANERRLEPPF